MGGETGPMPFNEKLLLTLGGVILNGIGTIVLIEQAWTGMVPTSSTNVTVNCVEQPAPDFVRTSPVSTLVSWTLVISGGMAYRHGHDWLAISAFVESACRYRTSLYGDDTSRVLGQFSFVLLLATSSCTLLLGVVASTELSQLFGALVVAIMPLTLILTQNLGGEDATDLAALIFGFVLVVACIHRPVRAWNIALPAGLAVLMSVGVHTAEIAYRRSGRWCDASVLDKTRAVQSLLVAVMIQELAVVSKELCKPSVLLPVVAGVTLFHPEYMDFAVGAWCLAGVMAYTKPGALLAKQGKAHVSFAV